MIFYCPNCRSEVEAEPQSTVTTKMHRLAYKAACPTCGQDMAEFAPVAPSSVPPSPGPTPSPSPTPSQPTPPPPSLSPAVAASTVSAYLGQNSDLAQSTAVSISEASDTNLSSAQAALNQAASAVNSLPPLPSPSPDSPTDISNLSSNS